MTYLEFKRAALGLGHDVDGYYGCQCWDFYAWYCQQLGVPYASCRKTGYVRDIWESRYENGQLNYFDEVEILQPGDIVFFKISPSTPLSHVAIFDSDAQNGQGMFLGQNQGAVGGVANLVCLPYDATYPTAFRPRQLTEDSPETDDPDSIIVEDVEGAVYRLYNPNTGDHLYTTNFEEARSLFGWIYEGVEWIAPSTGDPVYRLFNGTHHLFTADKNEKEQLQNQGWMFEGEAFFTSGNHPIYRMYNPNGGEHLLTSKRCEHDALSQVGWYCEGQSLKY